MKFLMSVVVLLLVLVLLAVTNPDVAKHRAAVDREFRESHEIAGALGAGKLMTALFAYDDYVFCSVTRYEGEVQTFGMLGVVVVL